MNQDCYCPAPWHGGFFTHNQQSVCCVYDVEPTTSIVQFYKSPLVRDLKQKLANNDPPKKCLTQCFDLERMGGKSQRQGYIQNFTMNGIEFVKDPDAPSVPQYLELRLSNLCNFKCRICNPTWSSMIGREVSEQPRLIKWYQDRNTQDMGRNEMTMECLDEIIDLIPNLRWINFTGGEPMVIPEVLSLIEEIRHQGCSKNVVIHFTTNVSVINPRIINVFPQHRGVQLTLSIDGIGSVAEYIRHGTVWSTVEKNAMKYGKMNLQMPNVEAGINVSLSAYAALTIDQTMAWVCDFSEKYQCTSVDMNYVEGMLSPLNLGGLARERAIDAMTKSLEIIREFVAKQIPCSPKLLIVEKQISGLLDKMLQTSPNQHQWKQFAQFTRDLDHHRSESFEKVFGFDFGALPNTHATTAD